jgi:signal transduction histidine kinase
MFQRARIRLTLLYIGLFALVMTVFSVVFYVAFATVLAPNFDIAPELSSQQAAQAAFDLTISRIGIALVAGNLIALIVVGLVAWVLASRTLRPIRDAHLRQRRFVADASHEMRTPLAAIRASAESALLGPPAPEVAREALEEVVRSTERLSRLTNDLLMLARTDERLLEGRTEAFDLSVVAAEAIEAFRATDRETLLGGVTFAPDLRVLGDRDEVVQILANLLDNAVRHGSAPATVRVSTFASEGDAVVEVRDEGRGIAAADQERIFEPFYRVRSDADAPPGSGLGLAIARSLAERNGGRLTLLSQAGAGSRFRLSLPRFR